MRPCSTLTATIATIIVLMLSNAPAAAAEVNCTEAQSTPELNVCAEEEYKKSDADLNRVYAQAIASVETRASDMTPAQRKDFLAALKKSQRAWVAFKEADCTELTGWEWYGGSGAATASWVCLTAKTQARTEELKDRYGER
jgi:uncharacterized protein YecT (DUF1311 family)